ncbi:hypothetical protein ScPMuIL_018409 [Solemya velum]
MLDRRRCKLYAGFAAVLVFALLLFAYFGDGIRSTSSEKIVTHFKTNSFPVDVVDRRYDIDIETEDVLVFLHIQKTGGSVFGRHLVRDLDLASPCVCYKGRKRCDCLTANKRLWLFSRYSMGWLCGLHADWTELQDCVESAMNRKEGPKRNRRYHYITILRNPISRYISEWKHVSRGATWKSALLKCNGKEATLEELPFCYDYESTWSGVTLDDFIGCEHNLASNRQTRMLANLSKINCYNKTGMDPITRDKLMLESAKENLKKFSFFGIVEFQRNSQELFEYTFNLKFLEDFTQYNVTHSSKVNVSKKQYQAISKLNKLDEELYQYAKDLFLQRVRKMQSDLNVDRHNLTSYEKDTYGGPDSFEAYDEEVEDEDDDYYSSSKMEGN